MTEAPSLPVFVVRGANWSVDVPLDEKAIEELDLAGQIMEAATQACEMILKYRHPEEEKREARPIHESFALNDGEQKPFIGAVLFVHPKGEDPNKAQAIIPAYIPLADGGFYMDSADSKRVLELEDKEGVFIKMAMRILFGDEMKARAEKNEQEIQNFEQLEADVNKSQTEAKTKPQPDLGQDIKPKKPKARKKKTDKPDEPTPL